MAEGAFKFSDHFWGTTGLEDGPYPGFVQLEQRVTEGKTMLSEFENVLLKRAEMEKAYGHALIKMAESSARQKTESSGELKQGWETLLQGLKTTGLAHLELGRHLSNDLGAKYKEYKATHSAKRKEVMRTAVSAHTTREKAYAAWGKAKTTYEAKCKESDDAERAAANPPADPKLAEKAKATAFKAQQNKEKAEYAYKQAVANAESTRVEFESKFTAACEAVEEFDRLRVVELRKAFWVYANLGSIAAVAEDNGNEHIRASLVNVDAEKDMLAFLATARTGSVRPVAVEFVAYGQQDRRNELAAQAQEAAKAIPIPTVDALAPTPIPTAGAAAPAAVAAPVAAPAATDAVAHDAEEKGVAAQEEDAHKEVQEEVQAAEEDKEVANRERAASDTVVIAYEGNGKPELTLQLSKVLLLTLILVNGVGIREFQPKAKPGSGPYATVIWAHNSANEEYFGVGDVVEIVERDEDPWWLGRIGDKSGVVHKGYLEPKFA